MKKNNAITLVALVITIVVLIILAGVVISLVVGNEGLLKKAKEGTYNYQTASNEEKTAIDGLSDSIEEHANGKLPNPPAEKVTFEPINPDWEVRSVSEALDYLFEI